MLDIFIISLPNVRNMNRGGKMKKLMTGNEAISRGAWEAGVRFASAYPGTPSTEILESTAYYKADILAEWAPNEKVAMEAVIGASMAGARAFAAMKHVGLNVAADPLLTYAYTGVNGGMVAITADEPGMHSSQNEQDNRHYARLAKIPMLEPADSQEAKDFMREAFTLSEQFDTPVLMRLTTRVCHSKGIVECGDRDDVEIRAYEKNVKKYITNPTNSRLLREKIEERMQLLSDFSNKTHLNRIEWNDTKIGIIASGAPYYFAREVFGDTASYLKLGFTYPLPVEKIREFAEKTDKLYVIEENDPLIEEQVRILGFDCFGKNLFPPFGEMTSDVIRKAAFGRTFKTIDYDESKVVSRPPSLCSGCPHRGFFYELSKRKSLIVSGDIGCYGMGYAEPFNTIDWSICMGSGVSAAHGAQQVLNMKDGNKTRVLSVMGDSTFFHMGINSLIDVVYNNSNSIHVILDNRITGMTGHQENPGTGYTLQGMKTKQIDIENLVRACGIENIMVINPNGLKGVKNALDWALDLDEPAVIIARWPCVLKRLTKQDKEEFGDIFTSKCEVNQDKCTGCKTCLKVGCLSISFCKAEKKAQIDPETCVGCDVCLQVCPLKAIGKVEVTF